MRLRRLHVVSVLLAGLVLGALAWAAFAPLGAESTESRQQVYVIPKGTWALRNAGTMVEILPSRIHLTIGVKDILVLRNQDDVPQIFGPVLIMPGQSFELPFRMASNYQFACSLHTSGTLDIDVDPLPQAGWSRLRWRAKAMFDGEALL